MLAVGSNDPDFHAGLVMKHLFLSLGLLFVCASGFACQQQVGLAREATAKPELNVEKKPEPAPEATLQKAPLKLPLKNQRILVMKSARRMELYSDGKVVRTYRVGLGPNPVPTRSVAVIRYSRGDFYCHQEQ